MAHTCIHEFLPINFKKLDEDFKYFFSLAPKTKLMLFAHRPALEAAQDQRNSHKKRFGDGQFCRTFHCCSLRSKAIKLSENTNIAPLQIVMNRSDQYTSDRVIVPEENEKIKWGPLTPVYLEPRNALI